MKGHQTVTPNQRNKRWEGIKPPNPIIRILNIFTPFERRKTTAAVFHRDERHANYDNVCEQYRWWFETISLDVRGITGTRLPSDTAFYISLSIKVHIHTLCALHRFPCKKVCDESLHKNLCSFTDVEESVADFFIAKICVCALHRLLVCHRFFLEWNWASWMLSRSVMKLQFVCEMLRGMPLLTLLNATHSNLRVAQQRQFRTSK